MTGDAFEKEKITDDAEAAPLDSSEWCETRPCCQCSGRRVLSANRREPWYSACCKTLALRRRYWGKLGEVWDDDSGDETDLANNHASQPEETDVAQQDAVCQTDDQEVNDEDEDSDVFYSDGASVSSVQVHRRPRFDGRWKCVETWGMEEFLVATGAPWVRRKAASRAPWPVWEFEQCDERLIFINRTALGDIREEVKLDGSKYIFRDGWKQQVVSVASWEGGTLVIGRDGPQGCFREERYIDGDGRLRFSMLTVSADSLAGESLARCDVPTSGRQTVIGKRAGVEAMWGRTFVRTEP